MKNKRQPLTASLLTLSTFVVTATAVWTSADAADVCYQDDIGRIVNQQNPRRRTARELADDVEQRLAIEGFVDARDRD